LDEAERLCDRVAIVHEGRIVALDRPSLLLAELGEEIVELRVDRDPSGALEALRRRGVAGEKAFAVGSTLTVPVVGGGAHAAVARTPTGGSAPEPATPARPTLEDVYLQRPGSRLAACPSAIEGPLFMTPITADQLHALDERAAGVRRPSAAAAWS